MSGIRSIACVILVVAFAGGIRAESNFNVDCFFGWGGCYRPMEWTPVEIEVGSTLKEPFAGSVHISANQDGLNNLNIANHFVLTPNIRLNIPLVTKLAYAASQCDVRVADEQGRTQWRHAFDLWDFSGKANMLTAVGENDLLIGLVGARKFGLLSLETQTICPETSSGRGNGKVYIRDKLARMVPWDWTGFVSLDLLILYDPDWSAFNRNQLDAIVQWVSNGGKLMVILGSHPLLADNPIARLLPVEIMDAREIRIGTERLNDWGMAAESIETVVCWPLKLRDDAHFCETQDNGQSECVFATGYSGFGRVVVLGFDPAGMSERQKAMSAPFWVGRLTALLEDKLTKPADKDPEEENASSAPPNTHGRYRARSVVGSQFSAVRSIKLAAKETEDKSGGNDSRYQYRIGQEQTGNNGVLEFLYNISELRPLSIWWVILLLSIMALLLGPVDYKVLKRYDRLPMTWITSAFWIILFSVGAYYGVQALRGGTTQLRVVSVIDGVEKSNCCWSTEYCGLFAPRSDDYQLKGLRDKQWWSGISPVQDYLYAGRQQAAMGRNIYCYQYDGSNRPYSLPINIWTMQCLMKESAEPQMPFEAKVERQGTQAVVSIVNKSDVPIRSGYVLFNGNESLDFGQIGGHATLNVSGKLKPFKGWNTYNRDTPYGYPRYSSSYDNQYKFESDMAYLAQGCLQRTSVINSYLAQGAAVVCVEMDNAPVSFGIKDRACNYTHKQIGRLIVFPGQEERTK